MKILLIITTLGLLISSCNQTTDSKTEEQKAEALMKEAMDDLQKESQALEIDLKTLVGEYDSRDEKVRFQANKKYTGQKLQITGRSSGMDASGFLRLQVESGDNALKCYGLSDEFMLSVNKEDVVQITGDFELKNISSVFMRHGVMTNCSGVKL